jgi:hypothetical protein
MVIENGQRHIAGYVVSEYKYEPAAVPAAAVTAISSASQERALRP